MKKSAISKTLLAFFLVWHLSDLTGKVSAYEVNVHAELSEQAYDLSVLKGGYLTHLGIEQETRLDGRSARRWIRLGSEFEDGKPIGSLSLRPLNHFYDPITRSGLLGLPDFIATDAINWGLELRSVGTLTQDWSIRDARNYFFKSLTDPDTKIREVNLAMTFQALGQVVHLIQDMAQPAHVRDDPHLSISENPKNILNKDRSLYEAYTSNGVRDNAYSLLGYPPVRFNDFISFWTENGRGLADFTNTNFVSEDTNFTFLENGATDGRHPNPTLDTNDFSIVDIQDINPGRTDVHGNLLQGNLLFFGNNYTDLYTSQTAHNDRMTTRSLFDGDLRNVLANPIFTLNQFNFDAQAKILLPRAVGYSAGLINYFFRGDLKVIPTPEGIKVRNNNNETMGPGEIGIYYDDVSSTRHLLARFDLTSALNPGDETPVIFFTHPTDNIESRRYIIVFQGELGQEEGAVIGKVTAQQIYYVSTRGGTDKIYRIGIDGSNRTLIYNNEDPDLFISFLAPSPDGTRLIFNTASLSAPTLFPLLSVLDLTTGAKETLKDASGLEVTGERASWSPDGTKIAFQRETGISLPLAKHEIFIFNFADGQVSQLTNFTSSDDPAWSPDGTMIASSTSDPLGFFDCGSQYIILWDLSGNPVGPVGCGILSPDDVFSVDTGPTWSSDNKEIAFMRRKRVAPNTFYKLYKANIETMVVTKLTESNGGAFQELIPSWSSDGKVIAISSDRDGDFDIWLVDPNGGGYLRNLTNENPDIDGSPAFGWSP